MPKREELTTGALLRVQWSGAWWAAKVKDATGGRVKIGYNTWSDQHDEWIDCSSDRLRLPLPEDGDSKTAPKVTDVRDPTKAGHKPFDPKPFNPEKEFRKRQLRLQKG